MRGPRISYPHAVLHVINRFVDRHPFFQEPKDYKHFLEIYFEVAKSFGMLNYAYCLMPNHFHFVLETPSGEISKFLQRFLTKAAKSLNFRKDRTGHLFQGRSKTLIVQTERYFSTVIAYVLMNPVRAGLSRDVFSYPWSSIREMLRNDTSRLDRGELWEHLFGHRFNEENPLDSIFEARKWLKELDSEMNQKEFDQGHRGGFLANKDFRKKVLEQLERRHRDGVKKGRRKGDRRKILWTWEGMNRAAKEAIEQGGMVDTGWRSKEKAIQQICWFLAHDRACWTWDQIRKKESMFGEPLSKCSVAIYRLKKNRKKMEIVELAENILVNQGLESNNVEE